MKDEQPRLDATGLVHQQYDHVSREEFDAFCDAYTAKLRPSTTEENASIGIDTGLVDEAIGTRWPEGLVAFVIHDRHYVANDLGKS